MFLPVPFLQQFLGERIPIGIALRVEPASRIAVPEPGAANAAAFLKGPGREAELAKTP